MDVGKGIPGREDQVNKQLSVCWHLGAIGSGWGQVYKSCGEAAQGGHENSSTLCSYCAPGPGLSTFQAFSKHRQPHVVGPMITPSLHS